MDISCLTTPILNSLIEQRFNKNTKLISTEISKFSNETIGFLSNYNVLSLSVEEDKRKLIETFFLKTILTIVPKNYFTTEVHFFSQKNPLFSKDIKTEPWSAKCYYADEKILIFENLKPKGYEMRTGKLTLADINSSLKLIARFHATSIIAQKKLNISLNNFFPDIFKEKIFIKYEFGWDWIKTGLLAIEAIAKNLNYNQSFVNKAFELAIEKVKLNENQINVFTHTDLWKNNILFNAFGNALLVDFQMVTYTNNTIDLLMFIYLNTNSKTRKKHEKNFIKVYHEELLKNLHKNNFETKISLQEIEEVYEQKRICGLITAVLYLPVQQKNEYFKTRYLGKKREYYMNKNRTELIIKTMKLDVEYSKIINEAVHEMILYFKK